MFGETVERFLSGLRNLVGLGEGGRKRGCTGITDYVAKETYARMSEVWSRERRRETCLERVW